MFRALWNSRVGMQAMQDKIDSISNNIANSDTTGYKKETVNFSDLVSETFKREGYPINQNGNTIPYTGTGVKANSWLRDNTQGSLIETDNNTDLAIDGDGYFAVINQNNEIQYTRSGNFNIDSQGQLVDSNGNRLQVQYTGNMNSVNKNNFIVGEDGQIYAKDGNKKKVIGKINLYRPVGEDSMISVGNNLYSPKAGVTMNTINDSSIKQGFEEKSNVDLGTEMTDLIVTQRAFEMNSKGLKTADDMMSIINNLRSK